MNQTATISVSSSWSVATDVGDCTLVHCRRAMHGCVSNPFCDVYCTVTQASSMHNNQVGRECDTSCMIQQLSIMKVVVYNKLGKLVHRMFV